MRRFCRILCFLLLTVAILCRNAVAQTRPHIILIVADDLVRAKIIISFLFRFSSLYSQIANYNTSKLLKIFKIDIFLLRQHCSINSCKVKYYLFHRLDWWRDYVEGKISPCIMPDLKFCRVIMM